MATNGVPLFVVCARWGSYRYRRFIGITLIPQGLIHEASRTAAVGILAGRLW